MRVGYAGTVYNGVLLKIDPPDPEWRKVALAEPFPRAKVAACRRRGCGPVLKARRAFVAATARVASLQEAIAVAANRYGNAAGAKDEQVQALHQATMRVTSALLAGATAVRNRAGARLANALHRLGIRRLTFTKAAVARALKASAAGRGIPKAVVKRMLRKKLITRASEVKAIIRAHTPKRAAALDVLAALRRPVKTGQMRAAAAELRLADVTRLLEAVTRDTGATAADAAWYRSALNRALRCDAGSQQALRDLATAVTGPAGVRGEGGLLVAAAARHVASRPLTGDDACRP